MAKYLCIWVRAYWFLVISFSKWLPGGHIRFFGFCMAWFRQRNSSLLWNFSFKFMCMSFVAEGRSLTIVRYVAFKMAALWFWTMFNCNPPIAHHHHLLWVGGILVDNWSTISSYLQSTLFTGDKNNDLGRWRIIGVLCNTMINSIDDRALSIKPLSNCRE